MKILAASLVLLATLPACIIVVSDDGFDLHDGDYDSSRPPASETRTVEPFHALAFSGAGEVNVRVGDAQSVVLSGPADLLPFVRTQVADGVLAIDRGPGAPKSGKRLRVQITVPALDAAALNGSGEVSVANVSGARFRATLAGSGGLRIGGAVEELELSLSGSGDANAYGLDARAAQVKLSGSGDVYVGARDTLSVDLTGSGDVHVRGSARVTQSVHGSGSVERD